MSIELFNSKYKKEIVGNAKKYKIAGMDFQDIIQELDIILWKKLPYFKGKNNATEKTFALKVIQNRIIDLMKTAGRQKRFIDNNHIYLEDIKKVVKGEEIKIDVEDQKWQRIFVLNMQNPVGAIWE